MTDARILTGDCRELLAELPAASVQTVVTSPPYWGLRDYGVDGQIGLESSLRAWIDQMVSVFREVRRVLRDDGTCWLNLGDSYVGTRGAPWGTSPSSVSARSTLRGHGHVGGGPKLSATPRPSFRRDKHPSPASDVRVAGLKPKDLVGQPWRVAFALQDDGWYLRQDIIWSKPNPMPESVRDRCTKAHEYLFLLSKNPKYFYDAAAVQEPVNGGAHARKAVAGWAEGAGDHSALHHAASKTAGRAEQGLRDGTKFGRQPGWRGTGRAPRGYRLEYSATGAVRDGAPVMKSRLVPSDESPVVQAYLQARAAGELRDRILTRLGLRWPGASLNGMDWQALTYAGHTVWNVHAEREGSTSTTGTRRRPRSEWIIRRSTHEALITDDEAEAILARLERQRAAHTRQDARHYLLTGLLVTPDGAAWAGDQGGFYRVGKGKRVAANRVDQAVVQRIFQELTAPATARKILEQMRLLVAQPVDGRALAGLQRRINALTGQIGKTVDMAAALADPTPVLRRVTELEQQRQQVVDELERLQGLQASQQDALTLDESDVVGMLAAVQAEMQAAAEPAGLKAALADLVERVELDPLSLRLRVAMRIGGGVTLASRRGAELSPPLRLLFDAQVPPRKAA